MATTPSNPEEVRESVRRYYADSALKVANAGVAGCGPCCGHESVSAESLASESGAMFYEPTQRQALPEAAVLASLGCGNPTAVAELRAARRCSTSAQAGGSTSSCRQRGWGRSGKAYGLDMTDEMLALARNNASQAGVDNVEFLKGVMEDVPLPESRSTWSSPTASSTCRRTKQTVFAEIARVLRPGGRLGVSDIVAEDRLSPAGASGTGLVCRLHRRRGCRKANMSSALRPPASKTSPSALPTRWSTAYTAPSSRRTGRFWVMPQVSWEDAGRPPFGHCPAR